MNDLEDLIPDADVDALRTRVDAGISAWARRRRLGAGLGGGAAVLVLGGALVLGLQPWLVPGWWAMSVEGSVAPAAAPVPAAASPASGSALPGADAGSDDGSAATPEPLPPIAGGVCVAAPVTGDHGMAGYIPCGWLEEDTDAWIAAHPAGSEAMIPIIRGAPPGGQVDTYTFEVPDLSGFVGACWDALANYLDMWLPQIQGRSLYTPVAPPVTTASEAIAESCR